MRNKLYTILFLTIIPYCVYAQLSTCAYYDGYWGEWKKEYYSYTKQSWYDIYGNYSGFIVYFESFHPSTYLFKFQINSYKTPTKDEMKYHRKNNTWYEYSGTAEYFVNSEYPTIKDALKSSGRFPRVKNGEGYKKTVHATIKIAPYKDHPRLYNIFFEDVAIALDIGNWQFNQ